MRKLSLIAWFVALLLTSTAVKASQMSLCSGELSLLLKGGVAPGFYTGRPAIEALAPAVSPAPFPIITAPRFQDQAHTPWTVGAELGWNASRHIQFFLEYAYMQAKGRSIPGTPIVSIRFSNFMSHAGYLGVRCYFDGWSSRCYGPLTPFIGFKIGLERQSKVNISILALGAAVGPLPYLLSQTAVSSGLQAGAEWWFNRHWSLLLEGEFIATQGPRTVGNVAVQGALGGVANAFIGPFRWLVTFPVTLALRWRF